MRLKERVTERAFQWNGITSDPSWWNMRHEHSRGRCLNLAAREDTERGRGNTLCMERDFVAKLQGFQNSNFYDFKILLLSNEVFTLHYKSVIAFIISFRLSSHIWFSGGSDGKKKICLQCRRPGFDPWVGKIPWRRKWQCSPVLLPGKFHGQRSLVSYNPWGPKESDTTEQLTPTYSHLMRSYSILFLGQTIKVQRDQILMHMTMRIGKNVVKIFYNKISKHFFPMSKLFKLRTFSLKLELWVTGCFIV